MAIRQDLPLVNKNLPVRLLHGNLPNAFPLIPPRPHNPMLKLNMPLQPMHDSPVLQILPDLLRARIIARPLRIPPETPLVRMAGDVARAARIAILEPRAADIVVLFVDLERHVGELAFGFVCDLETRGAGADYDHAQGAQGVEGLLVDSVVGERLPVEFVFVEFGFPWFVGGEELGL